MVDIILKKAQSSDAPMLLDLLQQMAVDLNKEHSFKGTVGAIEAAGFSESPVFEAIIAWREGIAIGFILYFYEFSSWRGKTGVYVQDLFVNSSARGLGLAKRLTKSAAEQGYKERNTQYMRLAVHNHNVNGFGFYQALGFQSVKDETIFTLEFPAYVKLISETVNCSQMDR